MKVTTRVAVGAALLVGLMLVALVHEMALVRELAGVQRRLSEERFVAVTSTIDVLRTLELSEERLQKLFVTKDPAYTAKLSDLGNDLVRQLSLVNALPLPAAEHKAVVALLDRWQVYWSTFTSQREVLHTQPGRETDVVRSLVTQLDDVRGAAVSLLSLLRISIQQEVEHAQLEARQGERLSWVLLVMAVLSGTLFVVLTMRSLNQPLARLIAATRTVAAGRYAPLAPRGSDELSQLARAFDAMVEQLHEADRAKREFLSHVSHELKTPLAAMQETNQLLVEELPGPLTDKQRRMLQLNLDAGRRLSAMLSRLLNSSRLEAGAVAYDVRPVDVCSLLEVAVQEFEARMRERRITGHLELPEEPVTIDADRDWLVQVFENLLENAIKFSPPERQVWVKLAVLNPPVREALPTSARPLAERGCALITITDEGPGVPADAMERIFERFFQVQRHSRAGTGVGLGLAICRDIVAAHGGTVWCENRVGGGTIFTVALPLPAGDAGRADAPRHRGTPAGDEGVASEGMHHRSVRAPRRLRFEPPAG